MFQLFRVFKQKWKDIYSKDRLERLDSGLFESFNFYPNFDLKFMGMRANLSKFLNSVLNIDHEQNI